MNQPRTLEEIKNDILSRVGHRMPFLYAHRNEAEKALGALTSLDPELWARVWSDFGALWEEQGKELEKKGNANKAQEAYLKAFGYYGIARHPFPSSPGKQKAYLKARETFLAAAKFFDPPLEPVEISFGDKKIVGHLRLPATKPAPVVLHWGGIDNWKEERHPFADRFLKEGWACLVIDSPGTGEFPVVASPESHRAYSIVLEYLSERSDIDSSRVAVVGASFGGYWSTKLAFTEPERIRAAVSWGGGVHYFFQPEWQEKSRHAQSYLFDLIEARANIFGKKTFDELIQVMPSLSLKDQGWLDRHCAPLLLVNGKDDKQVPLEDIYLLIETGEPKAVRLFPGGHMGPIPQVFDTVVQWLHAMLDEYR